MKKWVIVLLICCLLVISGCIQVVKPEQLEKEKESYEEEIGKAVIPEEVVTEKPKEGIVPEEKKPICRQVQVPYEIQEPYVEQEVYTVTEDYVDFEVYAVTKLKTIYGTPVQNLSIVGLTPDSLVSDSDVCEPKLRISNPNNVDVKFNVIFTTLTIKGDPTKAHLEWEIQSNEEHTIDASGYLEVIGQCYIPTSKDYPYDAEVLSDSIATVIVPNEFVSYQEEPQQRQVIKQREVIKYRPVTKYRTVTQYRTETVCE